MQELELKNIHVFQTETGYEQNKGTITENDLVLIKEENQYQDYIIERGGDDTQWYELYKSGRLVQGGFVAATADANSQVVTFLKPFSNDKYTCLAITKSSSTDTTANARQLGAPVDQTTTQCTLWIGSSNKFDGKFWVAWGWSA